MAADRSGRVNAGKNISTAYGGFEEVSGDEFYKSEEEEEDLRPLGSSRPF